MFHDAKVGYYSVNEMNFRLNFLHTDNIDLVAK